MAFRFRRGTDLERQSITPRLGEPLYVTDTGELYIGDGTTQGGNLVSISVLDDDTPSLGGNLDLAGNNIVGTGNIDIDGYINATGNINLGDGAEDNIIVGGVIESSLVPGTDGTYDLGDSNSRWRQGWFEGLTVDGEINANSITVDTIANSDSTIIWESSTNELQADLRGSVYAQDSGIIINAETGDISATDISAELVSSNIIGSVFANDGDLLLSSATKELVLDRIISNDLRVERPDSGENITSIVGRENRGVLRLENFSENDISVPDILYGSIFFQKNDINGPLATGVIAGTIDSLLFTTDSTGAFANDAQFFTFTDTGFFGIGTRNPQSTLDVRGSAVIEGNLTVSALKGSVVSDDSTIIIDSVDNTITSGGYIQFGSYTSADRPNGVNGMVIYNSTVDRFQGFQANGWINLDDGTAA